MGQAGGGDGAQDGFGEEEGMSNMLTLTGIDAGVDASWIRKMGRDYCTPGGYTGVEFAILRSPKAGQSPRYPTRQTINAITNYVYPNQLAFHLCGRYARMVHDGEWGELCDIIDFSGMYPLQTCKYYSTTKSTPIAKREEAS